MQLYRFSTGTAEFVICRNCGVYIGAICETASGTRAVINTTCLDDRALFTLEPAPTDHGGETTEDRLARRDATWTPATIPSADRHLLELATKRLGADRARP